MWNTLMLIPKGKPKEDVEKVDVSKAAYISFVGTDSHDWEISILEDLAGNPIVMIDVRGLNNLVEIQPEEAFSEDSVWRQLWRGKIFKVVIGKREADIMEIVKHAERTKKALQLMLKDNKKDA